MSRTRTYVMTSAGTAGVLVAAMLGLSQLAPSSSLAGTSTTITVTPTDDSYDSQAASTTTFGTSPTMTSLGATGKVKQAFLKFAVSAIPSGATVTGAVLTVTALNSSGVTPTLKRQSAGSWSESTLTWASRPALGTSIASAKPVVAGPVSYAVQTVVKGNGSFSFDLTQGSSKPTNYSTKEGASPPTLTVTYQAAPTPPPTTASPTGSDSSSPSSPPTTTALSSSPPDTSSAPDTSSPPASSAPPAGPCGTSTTPPATYDHVIWILMENKTYSQVIGDPTDAPYINSLASACASVQGMNNAGSTLDSLPNYLALTSGDTQGLVDNVYPDAANVHADNLFRQVLASGLTTKSYDENMGTPCQSTDPGTSTSLYRVKHNPWPYYLDDGASCLAGDVPLGTTSAGALHDDLANGTLPSFSFVTPNMVDDMHNGVDVPTKVRDGDGWLQRWLPVILNSSAYASGRTAVFVLWDESTPTPNLFLAPSVVPGTVVPAATDPTAAWSHYSVLRTTEEMLGLSPLLGAAASAASLRAALGI